MRHIWSMQTQWYGSCFTESRTTHHHTVLTTFQQLLSLADPGAKLMWVFIDSSSVWSLLPASCSTEHCTWHAQHGLPTQKPGALLQVYMSMTFTHTHPHTHHIGKMICVKLQNVTENTQITHTHTHTNKGSMQIQWYSSGAKHESKQGPKHIVLIRLSNNKKHNSLKIVLSIT